MRSVGSLLWDLRQAAKLSLGEVARLSGVSKASLSRWETGTHLPRIPELEAVFSALNADTSERFQLLSAIEAPRAVRQLRHATAVPPPTVGDLLRALRLRKGWTPEQLASALHVNRTSVGRWEQGERLPSTEQIQAICYALDAREEELTALTCGRARPSRPPGPVAIEDIDKTLRTLQAGLCRGMEELLFWTMEYQVWELLAQDSTVLPLAAEVYIFNGQHSRINGRWSEIPACTDKACALLGKLPADSRLRIHQEILRATAAVHQSGTPRPRLGLRILAPLLEVATDQPEYHAWVLSDMAKYQAMDGQSDSALELAVQAIAVAERSVHRVEAELRRMDYADLLIRAGRPADALSIFPNADLIGPEALLVRVEAEYQVGNHSEAASILQIAIEQIETSKQAHLRPRADALAARF